MMMMMMLLVCFVALAIVVERALGESCFAGGSRGACLTSDPGGCQAFSQAYCRGSLACCVPAPMCNHDPPAMGEDVIAITRITSYFYGASGTNIQYCGGTSGVCTAGIHGDPLSESQVRWGFGVTEQRFDTSSGLGFTPKASRLVNIEEDFVLGTFIHYNLVIQADNIPPFAMLHIAIKLQGGEDVTFDYRLEIDETLNQMTMPCSYEPRGLEASDIVDPCPDRILLAQGGFSSRTFTIPNSDGEYTLELTGFKQQVCSDEIVFDWITQEKVVNEAVLYGRITRACPPECPNGGMLVIERGSCRCNNAPTAAPGSGNPPNGPGNGPPSPASSAGPPNGMMPIPPTPVTPNGPGTPNGPNGPGTPNGPDDQQEEGQLSSSGAGNTGVIVGVAAALGLLILGIVALLVFFGFKKATTGSFFGAQLNGPDNAIADNPLYMSNQIGGDNVLYQGKTY